MYFTTCYERLNIFSQLLPYNPCLHMIGACANASTTRSIIPIYETFYMCRHTLFCAYIHPSLTQAAFVIARKWWGSLVTSWMKNNWVEQLMQWFCIHPTLYLPCYSCSTTVLNLNPPPKTPPTFPHAPLILLFLRLRISISLTSQPSSVFFQ